MTSVSRLDEAIFVDSDPVEVARPGDCVGELVPAPFGDAPTSWPSAGAVKTMATIIPTIAHRPTPKGDTLKTALKGEALKGDTQKRKCLSHCEFFCIARPCDTDGAFEDYRPIGSRRCMGTGLVPEFVNSPPISRKLPAPFRRTPGQSDSPACSICAQFPDAQILRISVFWIYKWVRCAQVPASLADSIGALSRPKK